MDGRRPLPLPLFMLGVFTTDDHDHAVASNYFTVFAARFHRCAYFHGFALLKVYTNFRYQGEVKRLGAYQDMRLLFTSPVSVKTMLIRRKEE